MKPKDKALPVLLRAFLRPLMEFRDNSLETPTFWTLSMRELLGIGFVFSYGRGYPSNLSLGYASDGGKFRNNFSIWQSYLLIIPTFSDI